MATGEAGEATASHGGEPAKSAAGQRNGGVKP